MMRASAGQRLLRVLGVLCAAAGVLAWIGLAWQAVARLDEVTPEGDEGGRLLAWGLTGTVLMIVGMVVLHAAADASRREGP
jgi:hypothetical protein